MTDLARVTARRGLVSVVAAILALILALLALPVRPVAGAGHQRRGSGHLGIGPAGDVARAGKRHLVGIRAAPRLEPVASVSADQQLPRIARAEPVEIYRDHVRLALGGELEPAFE